MNETNVQTLAGLILRLQERVVRLERRLDAHDRDHQAAADDQYHVNMDALEDR